jgi:hypothetical protein
MGSVPTDAKGHAMLGAISNLQRTILQTAATRQDRLLAAPPNLKGGAAKQIAEKFLSAGWVKEIRATKDAPVWPQDAGAGQPVALKLTPAGKKVIEAAASGDRIKTLASTAALQDAAALPNADLAEDVDATSPPNDGGPTGIRAPRPGSKLDRVLAMLAAESGATLDEIVAATGWLPHSTPFSRACASAAIG